MTMEHLQVPSMARGFICMTSLGDDCIPGRSLISFFQEEIEAN